MRHIKLKKVKHLSSWRKVSMNTWKMPVDPSTYGLLKFDATNFQEYTKDKGVTPTHLFTKIIAQVFHENPQINRMIRGAHLYQRESVDIFLQVSVDHSGRDLSGTVIRDADKKSVFEIKKELMDSAKSIRNDKDKSFKKVKKVVTLIPNFLARPALALLDIAMYRLNFYTGLFSVKRDPFGSCMITSVGNFGAEFAFAPIPTISHVPIILSLFKVKEEAIVENGEILARPTLTVGATLDHRIIDGVYASKIIAGIKKYTESPQLL
ncbi:2-oxo acid dehydrogenase subunit E2 [Halobacteriovorax sp. HFRX-2_2]|uniref:2-oxo acid dehydrogenase subunit E2 n=1 Tax=unclassified Halobacteriovorax TaxID=2639665 RepID=UPI0037195B39